MHEFITVLPYCVSVLPCNCDWGTKLYLLHKNKEGPLHPSGGGGSVERTEVERREEYVYLVCPVRAEETTILVSIQHTAQMHLNHTK